MLHPLRLTALLGSLALPALAQAEIPEGAAPASEAALERYRGDSRPILVFAPDAADPRYQAQIEALEAAAEELAERDMVVLADTDPAAGSELRRGIGAEDAALLLVGKDGGVKLRAAAPVSAQEIIDLVDGMPMRRREAAE
ncbi:DUF4174 domain-containing protein [Poseidonocella sp. HB161398]|uniref:DUF4174 domain-containing protein n=1 Tax=Poseidonocella sp. HB161398 TaxID=2320855 RepID=UPI001108DD0A|nr:DUF4174 domain-containing protein [Poseidonocella sp. HB161398]